MVGFREDGYYCRWAMIQEKLEGEEGVDGKGSRGLVDGMVRDGGGGRLRMASAMV